MSPKLANIRPTPASSFTKIAGGGDPKIATSGVSMKVTGTGAMALGSRSGLAALE
jgi:hypothetical protein